MATKWGRRTKEQIATDEIDRDLLRRFKQGDDYAFTRLARKYDPLIGSLVKRYSRRAVMEPDELRQLLLVQFWRIARGYKPSEGLPFRAWARWALSRQAKDLTVQRARLKASEPLRVELVADIAPAPEPAPSEQERREDFERVMGVVRLWTPDAADLFRLTVLRGLSVAAAAKRLGLNTKAAESRIHKARKKLRDIYGDGGTVWGTTNSPR